jgi:hypothetical protein
METGGPGNCSENVLLLAEIEPAQLTDATLQRRDALGWNLCVRTGPGKERFGGWLDALSPVILVSLVVGVLVHRNRVEAEYPRLRCSVEE